MHQNGVGCGAWHDAALRHRGRAQGLRAARGLLPGSRESLQHLAAQRGWRVALGGSYEGPFDGAPFEKSWGKSVCPPFRGSSPRRTSASRSCTAGTTSSATARACARGTRRRRPSCHRAIKWRTIKWRTIMYSAPLNGAPLYIAHHYVKRTTEWCTIIYSAPFNGAPLCKAHH